MPTATMTSKGQLTVPKEIRDRLGLEPGDQVRFEFVASGELRISVRKPLPTIVGKLARYAPKRPLGPEEIDEAIARHHAAENRRLRRHR
ncbi:MAG: hypothetical protein AMXMBFR36_21530 [Acidobacteriota bacterium]